MINTLEMIGRGENLAAILEHICRTFDAQVPNAMSSVLLADPGGTRLRHAAGVRLPRICSDVFNGGTPAACLHSCGAAAFLKERLPAPKIHSDVLNNGLQPASSLPLVSKNNELLGVFCLFFVEPRKPHRDELRLVEAAARIVLVALEKERTNEVLTKTQRDLEAERDRLRLLLDVQQAFAANMDLRNLFETLATSLRRVTGFGCIGLALADRATGQLRQHFMEDGETGSVIGESMALPAESSAAGKAFRTRQLVCLQENGVPSGYFLPLTHRDEVIGVLQLAKDAQLAFDNQDAELGSKNAETDFLYALAGQLSIAVANALEQSAIVVSRDQLSREQVSLRKEIDRSSMFEGIVGCSDSLRHVLSQVEKVARVDSTVLILGETGTGKELIARAIHKRSNRANRPFIRVNCAAIPASLVASELFGHEKGAFTGAHQRRLGKFELAEGGTIFLDEVGDLPMDTQIALLRVLQEREIERVGGNRPIPVDVRVLAATHRDMKAAATAGTLRHDLYYRLNVVPIQLPSLRDRAGDVPLLVNYFIDRYAGKAVKKIRRIEKRTMELLQTYKWPGNIRELQNVVERAVILSDDETFYIDEKWLNHESPRLSRTSDVSGPRLRLDEVEERELIEAALAESAGRVGGQSGAASKLGIPRQTLESKISSLGINKYRFKSGLNN